MGENSEVFPLASVAVAVNSVHGGTPAPDVSMLKIPPVATSLPRKVSPSP